MKIFEDKFFLGRRIELWNIDMPLVWQDKWWKNKIIPLRKVLNHNLDYNNVIYDDTYENVIFRNRIK